MREDKLADAEARLCAHVERDGAQGGVAIVAVRELGVVPEGDMSVLAVSVSSSSSKRTVPPVRERRVLERALGFMVDSTSQRRTRRSRTRRRHLRSRPVSR